MKRRIFYNGSKKIKSLIIVLILAILLLPIVMITFYGNNNENKSTGDFDEFNISNLKINNKDIIVGKIKVYITDEKKIETLNLEDYVAGVVSKEMPVNFNIEALKAQAVAARTYAVSHMQSLSGGGCSLYSGADVCDTIHCQVYKSKEEKLKEWPEKDRKANWDKITEVVKSTANQVLTYNGELVLSPLYFSSSGGETANSEDVFAVSRPYLRSVDSPGEDIAPNYISTVEMNYDEMVKKINSVYPDAKLQSSKIKNQIKIISTNNSKMVTKISVGNITLTGAKFRMALGLRSATFQLEFKSQSLKITCIGYGHGVGMSQWGANVMAKKGSKYQDILIHYYQGVNISKIIEKE